MSTLPQGIVDGTIKRYQDVIRDNPWYSPTLRDVDIPSFLVWWGEVHVATNKT